MCVCHSEAVSSVLVLNSLLCSLAHTAAVSPGPAATSGRAWEGGQVPLLNLLLGNSKCKDTGGAPLHLVSALITGLCCVEYADHTGKNAWGFRKCKLLPTYPLLKCFAESYGLHLWHWSLLLSPSSCFAVLIRPSSETLMCRSLTRLCARLGFFL